MEITKTAKNEMVIEIFEPPTPLFKDNHLHDVVFNIALAYVLVGIFVISDN